MAMARLIVSHLDISGSDRKELSLQDTFRCDLQAWHREGQGACFSLLSGYDVFNVFLFFLLNSGYGVFYDFVFRVLT